MYSVVNGAFLSMINKLLPPFLIYKPKTALSKVLSPDLVYISE